MKSRPEIFNEIIRENGFTSYLEIGLGDGSNYNSIKCKLKDGVDPNPKFKDGTIRWDGFFYHEDSDDFFNKNMAHYDLIFIDGFHHSDQVERDIVNSWNCLNKGGMILIHDVKPKNFQEQQVPMGKYPFWTGDVWRAWYGFRKAYPKIKVAYIEEENGLGVIYKSKHKVEAGFVDMQTDWATYDKLKGWEV